MGFVKEMLICKQEELEGESHDDVSAVYAAEMEQIKNDHILADYVILGNGKRCYMGSFCYPVDNVCECNNTF